MWKNLIQKFKNWKPIHLCWFFNKMGWKIPRYLVGATYTSQYPPEQSDTYVKATTSYEAYAYPYEATDPAKSLTGTYINNTWHSDLLYNSNQRFHIDLGSGKAIRRIYYENFHHNGDAVNYGVNNFTLWGSNTEASFLELTYGIDTGWTELTVAQNTFDEHSGADEADPKYIVVTNSTEYRYYALKFVDNHGGLYIGVRRIELQTEDDWTPTFEYVGTGSLAYSGTAIIIIGFTYAGSGDFVTSGSGICQYEKSAWEYAGSGELAYSGEATQSHTKNFLYDTSGNFAYSGEATISYILNYLYVGDGQFTFGGTATQIYSRYYLYTGSGVFTYSGEAVLRWGDWSEIGKEGSDWTKVEKLEDG